MAAGFALTAASGGMIIPQVVLAAVLTLRAGRLTNGRRKAFVLMSIVLVIQLASNLYQVAGASAWLVVLNGFAFVLGVFALIAIGRSWPARLQPSARTSAPAPELSSAHRS